MLFLVEAESHLPPEMGHSARLDLIERERTAGAAARSKGHLRHIWRIPGQTANVAIWEAPDADVLHELLTALPAWPWMRISVRALASHPLGTPLPDEPRRAE